MTDRAAERAAARARMTSPPLPAAFRWAVVGAVLVAAGLRAAFGALDPSVFLQAVFSLMGLLIAAPSFRGGTRGGVVAQRLRIAALSVLAVTLLLSPFVTVPALAPLILAFMVLMWAYMARQFGCFVWIVLLALLVPIAGWGVYAMRGELERDAWLRSTADDIASVTLRSPDGTRTVTLTSPEQRSAFASLLSRATPLYPNHEGITDAWTVTLTLRDRRTQSLLLGHGSRSRRPLWLEAGPAHDFAVSEDYDTVVARLTR